MKVAAEKTKALDMARHNTWQSISNLGEAIQIAELVAKSNALPDVRNAGQALLKILAGAEMGFGPFASLTDVHIIEGKPSVGAHLKAAAIKRSDRYDFEVIKHDDTVCELAFYERQLATGGETRKLLAGWVKKPLAVSLTIEEVNKRGLNKGKSGIKTNWAMHTKSMLFARCISEGYRQYCADLTGGVLAYDPDELESAALPAAQQPAQPQLPLRQEVPAIDVQPEPVVANVQAEPTKAEAKAAEPIGKPVAGLIEREQNLARIAELGKQLKIPESAFSERLVQQFGKNKLELLDNAQVAKVCRMLEVRIEQVRVAAQAEAGK